MKMQLNPLFVVPRFPARTYPGKTMGPDYLAAQLIRNGLSCPEKINIVDLDVLSNDAFSDALRIKPDFIGISTLSFQLPQALEIAKQAHEYLSSIGMRDGISPEKYVPIIIGNHGAKEIEEIASNYNYVDAWAQDHAFETIIDIANAVIASKTGSAHFLDARRNISGIVYYNKENGIVVTNQAKPLQSDIDAYFPPFRKHYFQEYNFKDIFGDKKTAQLITQIGCPASCVFCFEGRFNASVHRRSIAGIKAELGQLVAQGYGAFYFDDSTFTSNHKYAKEIIAVLSELHKKHGIVWGFNTRVDTLDSLLLKDIAASGCVYMFSGVESLAPSVIEGFNKVNRHNGQVIWEEYWRGSEQIRNMLEMQGEDVSPVKTGEQYARRAKQAYSQMHSIGLISPSAFLIFGGPSKGRGYDPETFEEATHTIKETVWSLNPKYISINILRFIPDAPMSSQGIFGALRGSEEKIHAGHFLPEWKKRERIPDYGHRRHPVYHAFEAAGKDYPIPPHMTPEYCYGILRMLIDEVNRKTIQTGEQTTIVVDKAFYKYLAKGKSGLYSLEAFDEMKADDTTSIAPLKERHPWIRKIAAVMATAAAIGALALFSIREQIYIAGQREKHMQETERAYSLAEAKIGWEQSKSLTLYVAGRYTYPLTPAQMEKFAKIANMIAAPPVAMHEFNGRDICEFNNYVEFQKTWLETHNFESYKSQLVSLKDYPKESVNFAIQFALGGKSLDSASQAEVGTVYNLVQTFHDGKLDGLAIYKNLSSNERALYTRFEASYVKNRWLQSRKNENGTRKSQSWEPQKLKSSYARNCNMGKHIQVGRHLLFHSS